MVRRRRSLLGGILRMVVVLLLVYSGVLGYSGWRISEQVKDLRTSYTNYEQCMESGDYRGALDNISKVAIDIALINQEAHMWQWQLARNVPIIGTDVACAQDLASIGNSLANDGLLEVVSSAEDLLAESSAADLGATLTEKADQLGALVETLNQARTVVAQCADEVAKLPESHFKQLNDLVDQMQKATTEANEAISSFGPVLDLANQLGTLTQGILPAS